MYKNLLTLPARYSRLWPEVKFLLNPKTYLETYFAAASTASMTRSKLPPQIFAISSLE
jgi:hypothetical protein